MSYDAIIERVRSRPEIWRFNHPLHKNREVHKRFWREVAAELQVGDDLVKKRWKHLKDQYRKELKKSSKLGIPDDIVSWKYFDSLRFLKDDLKERDKDRLLSIMSKEKDAVKDDDDDDDDDDEEETTDDDNPLINVKREAKRLTKAKIVRHHDSQMMNIILQQVSDTKSMMEYRLNLLDDSMALRNDPDYLFLMSLMCSMKQLTDIQKLQFKSKVNDFLLQMITKNTNGVDNSVFETQGMIIKPEVQMSD
ncbi:hypothetical protein ACJJTC_008634 [Scirpophaga incertulas]